ncbi:uncharacterized protein [Diabrotica undecimpunctata]|uniref:uncharacterized protein isoform X3 n=1 Tax=Diabrotica undecimpunctata TaxID=50387 RepID=UPI003B63BA00
MEVKIEVKEEFDEYDQRYVASQLSTELDLTELKDESAKYSLETGNKSYPQDEHKMENMETLIEDSAYEGNYMRQHSKGKTLDTNKKKKSFKCEICFNQFTRADNLKTHIRLHTGEKSYKCEICFKQFTTAGYLQDEHKMENMETLIEDSSYEGNYMRQHSKGKTLDTNKEKSFKCEICFNQFTRADNLKTHIRLHTGEKSYKCEICFKQFSQKSHMKEHLRTHTGEKSYKCEICFKQFSRAEHLKTHLRVHTGEKSYKCEICFKQFSQAVSLARHLRVHTGEKSYKCEICFKQFTTADLRRSTRERKPRKQVYCPSFIDISEEKLNRLFGIRSGKRTSKSVYNSVNQISCRTPQKVQKIKNSIRRNTKTSGITENNI